MSELSDFFDAQDEREMEGQCGNLSPRGDWCAKPLEHDYDVHRSSWKANIRAVWNGKGRIVEEARG